MALTTLRNKISKTQTFLFRLFSKVGKRKRFLIACIISAMLLLVSTFYEYEKIIIFIPLIFVTVYIVTYISILEGIHEHERISLFIHPVYFSVAFYLFYFFLPQRWLTRLPFVLIYSVTLYAILLSQNIFNVGVQKSLQLFRAAFSVNYLLISITSFIMFSIIASLRLNFMMHFIVVTLASFPLLVQFLWSIEPKNVIEKPIIHYSMFIALLLGQVSVIMSFIPVNQSIFSLVLTAVFYSLGGLYQVYIQKILFKERIREYVMVLFFTFCIFILSIQW